MDKKHVPSEITIYVTKDYGLFNLQNANRTIQPAHVLKVEKKIKQKNLLRYHPIVVNREMEVIDGQHRLEVAKKNKIDIYYVIDPNAEIFTTRITNSTPKNWGPKDYLDSYCMDGLEQYQRIDAMLLKHKHLTLAMICFIYYGGNSFGEAFKEGKFKARNSDATVDKIAQQMLEFGKIEKKLARATHLCRAMVKIHENCVRYDFDALIDKCGKKYRLMIDLPNDQIKIQKILMQTYNFKRRNKVDFFRDLSQKQEES